MIRNHGRLWHGDTGESPEPPPRLSVGQEWTRRGQTSFTPKPFIAHLDLRQNDIPTERDGDGPMGAIVAELPRHWQESVT